MGTPFQAFVDTCKALQGTSRRSVKVEHVAHLLESVEPDERSATARFLAGQTLSPLDERSLHVGRALLEEAGGARQATLTPEPATIRGLASALDQLADVGGHGSEQRRRAILDGLVGRLDEEQRSWLVRLIQGELRTGVQAGLVLEAIAIAADVDPEAVRRVHMLRGDLGEVAHLAIDGGSEALDAIDLETGRPVRPMLAQRADDVADALVELGGPAVFEHKLDGARIQIHRLGEDVRVFSRRLTEVTGSLPEAVELGRELSTDEAVVEGEAVAYDEDGHPLPFQHVMRRLTREHDRLREAARVPVRISLFDCLRSGSDTLIDEPLTERWARLREIAPTDALAERLVTDDPSQARELLERALEAGHEGAMAKRMDSPYVPGHRGQHWLKIKPAITLDTVVLGAEWGHGRREGWLSNLHLGVRVPPGQQDQLAEPSQAPSGPVTRHPGFAMVGKTFKGMTDAQLDEITERLQDLADERPAWGVVARPELVVEVAFDEVQESPHYASGYALRFARVEAIRGDKPTDEVATLAEVARIHEADPDEHGGRVAE